MVWIALLALVAVVVLTVCLDEERRRRRWRELSLEARLRESGYRAEVFERALARLRADRDAGKLTINEDYRALFDRLTAEARLADQQTEPG